VGLFRHIFRPFPARFSEDVRWAVGYSHEVAVYCGAPKVNTAHVLAGVARHPKGNELLAGHARDVLLAVCGTEPSRTPTPIPAKGRLETEEEFESLIQAAAKDALGAPKRSPARTVELGDLVRIIRTMPQCTANPVLRRFGLDGTPSR
jgi:hypothetical protein